MQGFLSIILLCLATTAIAADIPSNQVDMNDPKELLRIAAHVNAGDFGWTADPAASGFASLSHVQTLLGTFQKGDARWKNVTLPVYKGTVSSAAATDFDARTQWPSCSVIGRVRSQNGCGSCWAFGSTESFEGSRCIATGKDIEFSADDTASCGNGGRNGCNGGQPSAANQWLASTGVVTGGDYGGGGCLPYVCPPCKNILPGHVYPPGCPTSQCNPLLTCTRQCSNNAYTKSYSSDKTKAMSSFSVQNVAGIIKALSTSGPLAVAFTVYADFPAYKSGVYVQTSQNELGGHAVNMQGWGVMDGKAYWLVKNSWSAFWGDGGYLKIKKGVNECGIEGDVSGTCHTNSCVKANGGGGGNYGDGDGNYGDGDGNYGDGDGNYGDGAGKNVVV